MDILKRRGGNMTKFKRLGKFTFMHFNTNEANLWAVGYKGYTCGVGFYKWLTYRNKFKIFLNDFEKNFRVFNKNYFKKFINYLKIWPCYFEAYGHDCDHTRFRDIYKFPTMYHAMKSYDVMRSEAEGPFYWLRISRKEYKQFIKENYEN